MRFSYGEGLASHTGSESCGGFREASVEVLTASRERVEPENVRDGGGIKPK